MVNIAARHWGWPRKRLDQLAAQLPALGFEMIEPDLAGVARWAGADLTAYDAAYVAVAEEAGAELITDDAGIVEVAPRYATPLAGGN